MKPLLKKYLALTDRLISLSEEDFKHEQKKFPWESNPYYPKPWKYPTMEWEDERKRISRRIVMVADEIKSVYDQMYPIDKYPHMHQVTQQQSLLEDTPSQALTHTSLADDSLVKFAESVFGCQPQDATPEQLRQYQIAQTQKSLMWRVDNGKVTDITPKEPEPAVTVSAKGMEILRMFENRRKNA